MGATRRPTVSDAFLPPCPSSAPWLVPEPPDSDIASVPRSPSAASPPSLRRSWSRVRRPPKRAPERGSALLNESRHELVTLPSLRLPLVHSQIRGSDPQYSAL